MRIPYFEVAAFASKPFSGNPAGVCPLDHWLPDSVLQSIAAENNLSETAFFLREGEEYRLRWFTPTMEVDLCGHATLASAFILFAEMNYQSPVVLFRTRSGLLEARREGELVILNFPSWPPKKCEPPAVLLKGLIPPPVEVLRTRDYLAIYRSQFDITTLRADMDCLSQLESLGVIVSAPGDDVDFVSRFFAPRAGVPEDPVTGSAHSTLIPFWAERLGKSELLARQLSTRGGTLHCRHLGERVSIGGKAVVYCRGEIDVPGV